MKKRLEIKERPDLGIYVKDKKEFAVNSAEHMGRLMEEGTQIYPPCPHNWDLYKAWH